jgi:glycosyltransferase involved in cell wall biosynthesis
MRSFMETTATITIPARERAETRSKDKPFVSLVVPAFNESAILKKNLSRLCEYMESLEDKYHWELILVNDGSTDETGETAETFAEGRNNITILHHMYNFRLGQALRYAFSKCRGDYIVTVDIDLSYSPDHIGRLLDKIRETRAKIVIASPYAKGGKVSNVPWLRKIMSVWANRFIAFFARDRYLDRLTTITGMVRAYDRVFLSKLNLKAMDMDINPEIIYKSMILRARIVEVPAHLDWGKEKISDSAGKTRKSSMRILRSILSSLISGFIFRPFMFFFLPGVTLLVISLYPLTYVFIHTFTFYGELAGAGLSIGHRLSGAIAKAFILSPHAFIVSGISIIIAIQLMSLGILALQNKRYFEETFHLGSSIYKYNRENEK